MLRPSFIGSVVTRFVLTLLMLLMILMVLTVLIVLMLLMLLVLLMLLMVLIVLMLLMLLMHRISSFSLQLKQKQKCVSTIFYFFFLLPSHVACAFVLLASQPEKIENS